MKKQEIFRGGFLDRCMENGCTGGEKVCILHKLL